MDKLECEAIYSKEVPQAMMEVRNRTPEARDGLSSEVYYDERPLAVGLKAPEGCYS